MPRTTITTTVINGHIHHDTHRHAFQSLLWNLAATERINVYGRGEGAVVGDLVFPKDSADADMDVDGTMIEPDVEILDADPAAAAAAGGEEEAADGGDGEGGTADADEGEGGGGPPEPKRAKKGGSPANLPAVHVVTKEDVEAGTFGLTDVVLPMPG